MVDKKRRLKKENEPENHYPQHTDRLQNGQDHIQDRLLADNTYHRYDIPVAEYYEGDGYNYDYNYRYPQMEGSEKAFERGFDKRGYDKSIDYRNLHEYKNNERKGQEFPERILDFNGEYKSMGRNGERDEYLKSLEYAQEIPKYPAERNAYTQERKKCIEPNEFSMHERQEYEKHESEDSTEHKVIKKTGRKKISMEYIEGKNKRSVTFSKRKKGIMKKAYELNVLTGTQILLLVASESGHVNTFATPKLKPIISNHERLIQQCLNAPSSPPERRMAIAPYKFNKEDENRDDKQYMGGGYEYYGNYENPE